MHYTIQIPGVTSSGTIEVISPWDQQPFASVETVSEEGIEKALAITSEKFADRSQWLPVEKRIAILEKTAILMREQFEDLCQLALKEGGKPLVDTRVEVNRAIDGIRNCIECMRSNAGEEVPMGVNAGSMNRVAFTSREPVGVVVAVSAFNHPLNLIVHQVGPAIAAGCPVIVKPAEDTPLSCFKLVEILREAGLPEEWCMPLLTSSHEVTGKLVSDSRVGFFSFIGSSRVGWMLRSKLAPGARCALEHGGVAPVIVDEDADIETVIPLIAKGGIYHAGQVCVSVQRVFAHASVVEKLVEGLKSAAEGMVTGDPAEEATDVGPLIRPREVQRVDEWVNEAVQKGAILVTGGKRISETCYEPTILREPPQDCRVSKQEVFGPVICVYSIDDIDEGIALANSLPVAFQASVFTSDIDRAMKAWRNLSASAVMVNDHTAFRVDWMPFAGLKESGLGVGGIPHTFRDMQVEKMMVIKSPNL